MNREYLFLEWNMEDITTIDATVGNCANNYNFHCVGVSLLKYLPELIASLFTVYARRRKFLIHPL